jgi:protein-L-isoaspartate(D-aspartate) O-methyltransferase
VPPTWIDQLSEAGTLTVPLRMRGLTRVVTFARDGDRLISTGHAMAGFVPIQGVGGHNPYEVQLADGVRLAFDDSEPDDPHALAAAMSAEQVEVWTDVEVPEMTPFDLLHVWLTCALPGTCKLVIDPDAAQGARPAWPVMGPVTTQGAAFAYPTCRKTDRRDGQGKELWQFGAIGYGPDGYRVAEMLAEQVRVWNRLHRSGPGPRFLVHRANVPDEQIAGAAVIDKRHSRVIVEWQNSVMG